MSDWNVSTTPASPSRRKLLAAMGAGAGVAWSGSALAQTPATTLKCSGAYTDALFHTQNLQQFASQVGSLTQGATKIEVVSNSKLMPMKDVLPALGKGDLALGEIFMSNFGQQYPLLAIDSLPFIVRGFPEAQRLWEATRQPIQDLLQKQGVHVLYAAAWPGQGLFSRAPINKLDDLKGLKFRVNNDATKYIAEVAGALPVDIAANNLAKAIQAGNVDVMVTSSTTGVDSQAWNAMGYFIDMRAWIPKNLVCISEQVWAKLPAATKTAMETAAKQAETRSWQLAKEADDGAQKILLERGVKISTPSFELRRSLDTLGERFAREWSKTVGMAGATALLTYYFPK